VASLNLRSQYLFGEGEEELLTKGVRLRYAILLGHRHVYYYFFTYYAFSLMCLHQYS
jgi:hypothetical protein